MNNDRHRCDHCSKVALFYQTKIRLQISGRSRQVVTFWKCSLPQIDCFIVDTLNNVENENLLYHENR